MRSRSCRLVRGVALLTLALPAQISYAEDRVYPAEWPAGPEASSLPQWARPGRIRFSRWDGGPLEMAKGLLSGWPGFAPPRPDYLYTTTTWYDPSTISLLRQAHINAIWVTFSNGFSIPAESIQRELLRKYIEECHRQGIRVVAYESIANIFWEEMYESVPESRHWARIGADGKPVPYGSSRHYQIVGRTTRYRAELSNPQWRAYLKKRIDLAIEAGADGITYDNNSKGHLLEALTDLYEYASSRKKDFLMMGNFDPDQMAFSRVLNALTSEWGSEPGIYPADHLGPNRDKIVSPLWNPFGRKQDPSTFLPVEGGFLVDNIGLLRVHQSLTKGYKPVLIECGELEVGDRFSNVPSGPRQQLAMAEAMMFGASAEFSLEGEFANGLRSQDPRKMEVWRDIGIYNRFFSENEGLYADTHSAASLGIVMDDPSDGVLHVLNALSARNVVYDILYEHDLDEAKLKPYAAIAVLTANTMRDRAISALDHYVAGGGKLFAAGAAGTLDETGRKRPRPAVFGKGVYYESLPAIDKLASALLAADRPRVRLTAPAGVVYNAVSQPESGRLMVHLLNYTPRPAGPIKVSVNGKFRKASLVSPDPARQPLRTLAAESERMEFEIPSVGIYSVLILEGVK